MMIRTNKYDTYTTTQFRKASCILTGDWHLRDDQPVCRTDVFETAQWRKLDFVSDLQRQHDCPVLHSGDLMHTWKSSPYLLSKTMEHLPKQFYSVIGNHDAPQHNLELINKSGINVLARAGALTLLNGCHFGQTPTEESIVIGGRKILLWHVMTYQAKEPYPGCTAPKAAKLLRQYSQYSLIITGDNHQPFVEEHEGRLLVNPGCLTRQTAAFADFKPRVYLYYAQTNTVEPVYLPIEEGTVSREHIDRTDSRDARIDAFVSRLSDEWEAGISIEENLERFAQANDIRESVMQIIHKAIEP